MKHDDEFLRLMDEYVENLAGLARVMQQVDRELKSNALPVQSLASPDYRDGELL
jgi:hypothetical protein